MKGKVYGARKRLSQLVIRAGKLGVDLQNSPSALVLKQTCGLSDPTASASASLFVLGLGLLTVTIALTLGHRHFRLSSSHCPLNRTQELHIQTLSWRLPPDEGVESTGLKKRLSGQSADSSLLEVDNCEDLDQFDEKLGHGHV